MVENKAGKKFREYLGWGGGGCYNLKSEKALLRPLIKYLQNGRENY